MAKRDSTKRVFQVYQGKHQLHSAPIVSSIGEPGVLYKSEPFVGSTPCPNWRFRIIASRNGQIVGGSQEAFDSKGNALRAARREASLYPAGVAGVEVAQ